MPAHAAPRVLTVEDNPIVRADLRLVLEEAGFSVCADARDGVEAIQLTREHDPDVILLDLALPRLGGVDATRLIRQERNVPIVALTGYGTPALVEAVMEAGASSCVLKPFAEEEVVGALLDALATHEAAIVEAEREESRGALARMLGLLGYPEDWAAELERRSYAAGKVWREGAL